MSRRGAFRAQLDHQLRAIAALLRSSPEQVLHGAIQAFIEKLEHEDQILARAVVARSAIDIKAPRQRTGVSDAVRKFVVTHYLDPARRAGQVYVDIRPREVHSRMGLRQRYTAVLSALRMPKFHRDQKIRLLASGSRLGEKVITFEIEQERNEGQGQPGRKGTSK